MKAHTDRLSEQYLVGLILALFVLAASVYSIVTPLFEMSDELWHYPMVKTIADGNGLPIQDPANPGPWKQEGSQPPLYYAAAALATLWVDTSDIGAVLRPNPHVDNGVITPDGNINLIVHNYRREAWPWRGTTLAVHITRFLSVIFGAGTVYFTYRIGLEVFPHQRWVAVAGMAGVAFTPMFAFISGAVNNDSLAAMLSSAALWLMLCIVREARHNRPTLRWSVALGIVLGLASLTKTSTLGLFGLAGLATAYAAWQRRRWQTLFVEGPLILALAAAIGGWWYLRNLRLYGDPLGLNVFVAILGRRARPASLLQLWGERVGFMQSYWGLFGGVNVPMPSWAYRTLNGLAILSVVGIMTTLVQKARRDGFSLSAWFPALLSLLWIAGVVLPLVLSWARVTWSSQGRLVFSAISCTSLWFMAGLGAPLPERWGERTTSVVGGFMAALTLVAPFVWIGPRYQLPSATLNEISGQAIDFTPPGAERPVMRLLGYELAPPQTQPGGTVQVVLYWESLAPMDRNWSTFVHLEDSAGLLAGQRDTYPGLGLIATLDIEPGYRWADRYVIPVDDYAYTPETLTVRIGLYDYASCPPCERMTTSVGESSVSLGEVALAARPSSDQVPNPIMLNFAQEMALVGYSLDQRSALPGTTIHLTLYWRGLRPMARNYTVSAQILGPETRIYGQKDSWPLDGAAPTSTWTPGSLVEDTIPLIISADTPPGIYMIQIVVYWMDDTGTIQRLASGWSLCRLVDDFVLLTPIRVGE